MIALTTQVSHQWAQRLRNTRIIGEKKDQEAMRRRTENKDITDLQNTQEIESTVKKEDTERNHTKKIKEETIEETIEERGIESTAEKERSDLGRRIEGIREGMIEGMRGMMIEEKGEEMGEGVIGGMMSEEKGEKSGEERRGKKNEEKL